MKSTKKIFAFILSLLMIMTMIPITALAANNIAYTDADGSKKTVASATTVTADTTTWSNGWYYVGSDVTISNRISVNGDVKLILGGGYTLTASQGIHVANGDKFTVYTQETAGSLIADGTSYDAAIGGNGKKGVSGGAVDTSVGTIIINGGNITASGGQYSAGIGGGWSGSDGNITINGGNITASSGVSGAGIGASQNSTGTLNINISGGIINATGGIAASAIGSGYGSDNTAVTINISGGIITARTDHISAADIGNGVHSNTPTSISITGGTIDVERIGNFDGGSGAVITEISGAIFINNPSAFILKGQYVVTDDGGKYHVYWGGAYISGVSSVNSISVVINGKTYAVSADEYRIVNGNLHLFVPQGELFVTVNGVDYYGVYSGNISELRKYYKVTDLSVMPVSIKANTAYELATTVTPESALNQTVSYEVTDAGNTGAFLNGNILTAPYGGELILKATAKDNYKSYSKTFTVKVTQTAVTGISGDSSIPTTTDPVHIALPMGVLPEDASHKKVEWSVVEGMAVITGETLKFTSSGKVIIRATVKNGIAYGKDFTKDYTINVNTLGLIDVSQGNVIFSKQDENTVKVIYGNGEQTTFPASQLIKVTGATEQYVITVESGSPNIVLDDCSITVDDYSAMDIMPDASVKLTLSGTNNLEGKCGIHVPSGASLSIDGTGTLTATAANRGAGIGGREKDSGGEITINGGTVTATGGMWGAGIGGGNEGEGGSITITGGIITATGGYTAAGIGGGNDGSGGEITINGGTVTATSGDYGAGIGGGSNKTGGNITINNGTVTATSVGIGAGIGGGARGGNGGNITINGGEVVARTENAGAGIGGGTESDGGIIVINGGNITATGSSRSTNGSAGIGGGNKGSGGNITINSGTVTATGGEYGAGIGGGRSESGGTIIINGGIINSNAGYGSAGIGGGYEGKGGNITINGGTVTATGMTNRWNEGTTGIGGGMEGDGGTVVITGGNIKAVPGNKAEAIGKSHDSPTSGTLKDADGNDLKLNTIALDSVAEDAIIEQVKGVTYGINDVKVLDTNKLYFYLPADTEVASVTADSTEYICNRNGTYYAHHGENGYINITDDTHDIICSECEKLFYAGVAHAYNDQKKCVCGHIDHTHSWSYTASGNVITATCSNADGYCPDTNGGTLTVSAPAELYTDGTISREAVIDNQLVKATDYTVSYSTADGNAPKTAGTYTASVTLGGATASVEFTLLNYAAKVTDEDGNLISNYKTLADAVTAAQENEYNTLTLLDDITVTTFQNINSGNFTIDLNGKTLLSESSFALRIQSGAHVIIKDSGEGGTVESKADGAKAVINYGGLTVESGTMKGDGGIDNRGFLNFIGGTAEGVTYSAIDNYASASVYGGVMKSENGNGITNDSGGALNVYGGKISGCSGIANYDTAFLSGGEFKGNSYAAINLISGTVEIKGGSFTGTDDEYGSLSGTPYGESTVDYTEGANLTLKGGEFPNGFTVHNTTANTLLADGYYFRNEQGKVVDGSSRIIEEKVTVEKGADFSADAVVTVEDVVYNGTAQEPTVTVKVGSKTLIEGKDYTLTFANNINAGTATVTVKAVGQAAGGIVGGGNSNAGNSVESVYTGEITKEFTILKADSSIDVYPEANKLTYNGEVQALVTAGLSKNGAVVYSLDGAEYSETIPTGTNAGEYTVYYKVEGDSNHNDSEPETLTVTIKAKDISDGFIILGEALTYNGTEQTQTVEKVLTTNNLEATYTVSDNKATNVGVYLLTVTGTGNFTGEAKLTFEIAPDTSKIDALTVDNVTSANKADVESVKAQIDNASTEYASYETKAEYNAIAEKCIELLAVIGDTADEIKRITDAVNGYDIDTVTGDDVPALVQLADDVEALLDTDNITEAEREALIQFGKDIQALISRYDRISAQIGDIKDRMLAYDEATVKSSDKADIEQLIADIKELTDGQNLTADEREYLINADAECDKLLAKIAETKSEYDRVIAAANGYDEATVTSADKDTLIQINADILALALTENVTAEEKENLQAAHDKVFALIDKLVGISDEIKRITEKVDAYVFESVKSSDKADIQQLIADIKALLDTQNLTADERALLETADETCDNLVAKIDETVAEIKRINNATNAYDEATVTSADKSDIEKLIADIKALKDGDNITDAEREQLVADDETLDALLAKINATADEIARIEEAVNGYDEETVKSTDKADLEQLKEDIKALTDATNITEDERTKLGNLDATLDSLIRKIDDTKAEIDRINEAVNGYDKETVTSAAVPELGKLIKDIKALTDGDNLTDDEKAALEANDEAIDELVEKLTEVAEEIKRVDEAVKSYDEATVKSSDSDELEQLKSDIQALIDSENTTENEKTALGEMIKDIEGLEDKVEETEKQLEEIKGIENNYNPEKVTSDDKAAIEEKIAEIEAVNPDNLTDEQKAEYDEIKAGFEDLLEEIEKAGSEVEAIGVELEMFDEERVTIFWEDEIEALKAKIDELLADENMGEAEKAKLGEYKAQCDNLIEIINTPAKYFSMRLFHFVWDALHWLSSHVVFIFNWIVSMF